MQKPLAYAVDDEFLILNSVVMALEKMGYDVEKFPKVELAYEQIKLKKPDAVVSDHNTRSEMKGTELMGHLNDSGIARVLLTGSDINKKELKEKSGEATEMMGKPFDRTKLIEAIERSKGLAEKEAGAAEKEFKVPEIKTAIVQEKAPEISQEIIEMKHIPAKPRTLLGVLLAKFHLSPGNPHERI